MSGVPGIIPNGPEFKALYIPGTYISNNRDGSGGAVDVVPNLPLTLSGWVYLRRYTNYFGEVFNKQYALNAWSSPFLSFGFQTQNTSDGSLEFYVAINGTLQVIRSNVNFFYLPLGRWAHIGGTYDGTTMRMFINGVQASQATVAGSTITYAPQGSRGQWYTGGIPGSSTNQAAPIIVQDIRIANVARPASYFANIYRQSFLTGE